MKGKSNEKNTTPEVSGIAFHSEEEVYEHYINDRENNQVVLFEGLVYDVKDYKDQHPGGPEYLMERLGKNIDEDFYDAEHTKSALRLFKDLPLVGKLVKEGENDEKEMVDQLTGIESSDDFDFDYTKPLVW